MAPRALAVSARDESLFFRGARRRETVTAIIEPSLWVIFHHQDQMASNVFTLADPAAVILCRVQGHKEEVHTILAVCTFAPQTMHSRYALTHPLITNHPDLRSGKYRQF